MRYRDASSDGAGHCVRVQDATLTAQYAAARARLQPWRLCIERMSQRSGGTCGVCDFGDSPGPRVAVGQVGSACFAYWLFPGRVVLTVRDLGPPVMELGQRRTP
jgi:hypothetical protein